MKKTSIVAIAIFVNLFLVGCSPDTPPEEPTGVIPEHQLKALEKAKQTEQLLDEAEKNRQKQLE